MVPYYEYALDMVLDVEMPVEDSLTEEQQEIVESAAEMLYGLIHARYVVVMLFLSWNTKCSLRSTDWLLFPNIKTKQVHYYKPWHARHVRKVSTRTFWSVPPRLLSGTASLARWIVRFAQKLHC